MNRKEQDYVAKLPFCLSYGFDYSSSFVLMHLILEHSFADYLNLKK